MMISIKIEYLLLTERYKSCLRSAITDFHASMSHPGALGDDDVGEEIRKGYLETSAKILADLREVP